MQYSLEEIRKIPIFFIVGKGRSGTTLLSTILDSHPEVASTTESRFIFILWQRYKNITSWKASMAEDFYQTLFLDLHLKKLWTFRDDFIDALRQLPRETEVQDLIKMVYLYRQSNFPKERIKVIVDKNPMFAIFIDKIRNIFPHAKFYRLMRDPRDNITSHLRKSNLHCGVLACIWLDFNLKIDRFAKSHPNDVFTQRFEDLILNKKKFFDEFEHYTGIQSLSELEEVRLNYKDEFEAKFDERLKDQHQASIKPLDISKIGHFKKALSKKNILNIEQVCFPYAEQYYYQREVNEAPISISDMLNWRFRYFIIIVSRKALFNLPFWGLKLASNYFEKKASKLTA